MGTRAQKVDGATRHSSDDRPVASIGDMAFERTCPFALQLLHAVPFRKHRTAFGRVLDHQIDDLGEKIQGGSFGAQPPHVIFELGGYSSP